MQRHTRAHTRFHWLRVAQKRRALYRSIWRDSADYLNGISLNQHADLSLARRCSCEMCRNYSRPPGWRSRDRQTWMREAET